MEETAKWTQPSCTPIKLTRSVETPSSSCHCPKTPLSRLQQLVHSEVQRLSSSPAMLRTPESNSVASRLGKLQTPVSVSNHVALASSRYYNPFENALLDTLHQPVFSPNVFKTSTPGNVKVPATFQWSIDDIAILKPVDFDIPVHHESLSNGYNAELEMKAQNAIDTYFSNHVIAPSPWTDSSKKKPFKLPCTPDVNCSSSAAAVDSPMLFNMKSCHNLKAVIHSSPQLKAAMTKVDATAKKTRAVAVQTMITIPADTDLLALLGERYIYKEESATECRKQSSDQVQDFNESCFDPVNPEMLSNSSLRRKLFFHGDDGTPISPVRSLKQRSNRAEIADRAQSPSILFMSQQQQQQRPDTVPLATTTSTLTDQFSSSPIRILHTTPTIRRCSTAPQMMESPTISPINCNYYYSSKNNNDDLSTPTVRPSSSSRCFQSAFRPVLAPSEDDDDDDDDHAVTANMRTPVSCTGANLHRARHDWQDQGEINADLIASVSQRLELSAFTEETSSIDIDLQPVPPSHLDTGYQSNIVLQTDIGYQSNNYQSEGSYHVQSHGGPLICQTEEMINQSLQMGDLHVDRGYESDLVAYAMMMPITASNTDEQSFVDNMSIDCGLA